MKPIRLVMQAFESYGAKTEIDFTKVNQNLFLIAGETGAGKTTIFNAITFALYGQTDSGKNKMRGLELQSQYADRSVVPYVQLTFEERTNGTTSTYTVMRSPAHYEPSKRKGAADQLKSEKVTLTMPDGSDYPEKEANRKIIDIIGLDKNQFMQVAMIAQGEFVDLVRTDSKSRKQIFRSIFHTDIYPSIVDELKKRSDEKREEMKAIRTECVMHVQQITIPDDYRDRDLLQQLVSDISSSPSLNPDQLNALMNQLQQMIADLKEHENGLLETRNNASHQRDLARDQDQAARSLQAAYNQLENAETQLRLLDAKKNEIDDARRLIDAINAAYEIENIYTGYCDAAKTLKKTQDSLKTQQNLLPSYQSNVEQLRIKRQITQKASLDQQASYAKMEERVQKAYQIFNQIAAAENEAHTAAEALSAANAALDQARKAQTGFEADIRQKQEREKQLRNADADLAECRARYKQYKLLKTEEETIEKLEADIISQDQRLKQAQDAFRSASASYQIIKEDYDRKNEIFLQEQAGFLAMKLTEGQPCPVCGSRLHPHPAKVASEHSQLTRARIDSLAQQVSKANAKQTAASENAAKELAAMHVMKQDHNTRIQSLTASIHDLLETIPDSGIIYSEGDLNDISNTLCRINTYLMDRGTALGKDTKELASIRTALSSAEETRSRLMHSLNQAVERQNAASIASNIAIEQCSSLRRQTTYPNKEAADQERANKTRLLQEAQRNDAIAEAALRTARSRLDSCQATIVQLRDVQIPAEQQSYSTRKEAYEAACRAKAMEESQWQTIVQQHRKNEVRTFQAEIEQYQSLKGQYEGMKATAIETIGGRAKPDLDALHAAMVQAQQQLSAADGAYQQCQQMLTMDSRIYQALSPKMQEHIDLARQFAQVDTLYRRLSGNQSGAHMDIETFVQRQYLQSILNAANQRFHEMSSGEFELRMIDDEHAGEGRTNQGLDLMVYSYATSEIRRVETLSGGETFMAALSLALGMADQIQAACGNIHLDMMFIDEGFGSLDDHARDNAIRVLKNMAGGSKLIGIISHVTELQQQIEDQLIVTRDVHTGSRAKWIIS